MIDAAPHVEVLPRAVRLARGVLFDSRRASLVRVDELLALGAWLRVGLDPGNVLRRVLLLIMPECNLLAGAGLMVLLLTL